MRSFRRLIVWRKAHELTLVVYSATRSFPADERFGLVVQLRRASASIGANIAEGCGRDTQREFARFVSIAAGSASEVEYHLLLARDLEFVAATTYTALDARVVELKRMLSALHGRIISSES